MANANKESRLEFARLETNKECEIDLAKQEHEHEMAKVAQQEKDREVELKRIESIERQANQDRETKFASEIELGKLSVEKAAHAQNRKLPYFEESEPQDNLWIVTYQYLRSTRS